MNPPIVTDKDADSVLKEIEGKAPYYTPEWKYGGKGDFGTALSKIFAHLSGIVINRLNHAPYRHSIAFLEMIGASILPPQPAKAPLTFSLSNGTKENVLIPASTRASAQGPDGKPIYFETDSDLIATPAKLTSVYSVIKNSDKIFRHDISIDGVNPSVLFAGEDQQKHILYLGDTNLFNIRKARVIIHLQDIHQHLAKTLSDEELVVWEYGIEITSKENGKDAIKTLWRPLKITGFDAASGNILLYKDTEERVSEVGLFSIKSRWIRCRVRDSGIEALRKIKIGRLKVSACNASEKTVDIKKVQGIGDEFYERLTGKDAVIRIETVSELLRFTPDELAELLGCGRLRAANIIEAAGKEFYNKKGNAKIIEEEGITPDMAFCDDIPADLSKNIYPFGMKPRLYSSFYLASEDAFTKKGYNVNLSLKLVRGIPSPSSDAPQLSWEYWDGEGWKAIEGISENMAVSSGATPVYYSVNTKPPAEECLISISSLPEIKKTKVNGKENYWIRIRLAGGDFGSDFIISGPNQITPGSFHPPEIQSLRIEYCKDDNKDGDIPEHIAAENNYDYKIIKPPFIPFVPLSDSTPAVYFGFNKPMKKGPMGLFVSIDETVEYPEDFLPGIKWSYSSGETGWKELDIRDGTAGFTKSGIIQFSVPYEMKSLKLFGESDKYWIKAAITRDFFSTASPPKIKGFHLNTAWAAQAKTIKNETLGSGNGKALQRLSVTDPPVIKMNLLIDEIKSLSESDMELLRKSGMNIKEKKDTKDVTLEFWVEWEEVADLLSSGSEDRHYVIDRTSGTVWFGDGVHGKIPPVGKDNIRADYRSGGGRNGNLIAGEIKKMQSSLASVDKVFNPVASEGGNDREDTDSLMRRAPAVLKNRGRAVAIDDFYCIVKEASRDIAKVMVLPNLNDKNTHETGWVTVVIAPEGTENKPVPSPALKRKVKSHLNERCPNVASIRVIPPAYIRADISTVLITDSIEAIPVIENEVRQKMSGFLHPLTGGTKGMGWEFGVVPCISDFHAMLEYVKNVDHVKELAMTLYSETGMKLAELTDSGVSVNIPEYALIYGGECRITVRSNNC